MSLEDLLKLLHAKVDRLTEEQVRQGAVLAEHQRRSLAAEENLALLKKEIDPLKTHVAVFAGVAKLLAALAALVAVIVGVARLVGWV